MDEPREAQQFILDDPVTTAVLANRLEGIVREMTNTLLRAGRSAVLAVARDFSCSIVSGDNQLLATAEGTPVHILGSHFQSASMCDLHPDLAEGDAFLHNDPYLGNTHPADHTILVPVFFEGEHLFTVCPKAHQADIGNSVPSTYHPWARDVYEEGSLIFPCVRVQRNYETIDDIIRMCKARIRVPEQWHGDFLAELGSARVGERRLKELCTKYGKETIKNFIKTWLDYTEQRTIQAIRRLPKAHLVNEGAHDPIEPFLPDGIPVKVILDIDPEAAMIEIDLRDNIDCIDRGLNVSKACALNSVVTGVFNSLEEDIPRNSGAFRRLRILTRNNCIAGGPSFPHSCSMATTNVADRLVNATQGAFAKLGDGFGLAEGGCGMGAGLAVISGQDFRRDGGGYINQLFASVASGPASPKADGWLTYVLPVAAGVCYRDSIEIDEQKHPMVFRTARILPGTGGSGRYRGAPASEVIYGPKKDPMMVVITSDGNINPAKGVQGGSDGLRGANFKINHNGAEEKLPNVVQFELTQGEWVRGIDTSGGGYGNPLERDANRVLHDVVENIETMERAHDVYGVVFTGSLDDETLAIDMAATERHRSALAV